MDQAISASGSNKPDSFKQHSSATPYPAVVGLRNSVRSDTAGELSNRGEPLVKWRRDKGWGFIVILSLFVGVVMMWLQFWSGFWGGVLVVVNQVCEKSMVNVYFNNTSAESRLTSKGGC